MAPEQAAGEPVDHLSDLFSLGVVLYRLLTGRLPFRGPNAMAALRSLAVETPPPPHEVRSAVPKSLSDLTMRLLAKDPAQRPKSADEVVQALAKIEHALSARGKETANRKTRQRAFIIVAALALVLLVPLTAWYAPAVYRIATNQGLLVIQTNDPDVEVNIKQNGRVVEIVEIVDNRTRRSVTLKAGTYQLELAGKKREGLKLETNQFTLTRGDNEIVKVWRELPATAAFPAATLPTTANSPTVPPTTATSPPVEPPQTATSQAVEDSSPFKAIAPSPPPPVVEAPAPSSGLATGPPRELRQFQLDPPRLITSVAFSPDGLRMVTGNSMRILPNGAPDKPSGSDADFTVRIWDLQTGIESEPLSGFTGSVAQVAFSRSQGRVLAFGPAGSFRRWTLVEWDVASKLEVGNFPAQASVPGTSAAVIDDELRRVIYGGFDGKIRSLVQSAGSPLLELEGHVRGPLAALAVSADGKYALSAGATRLGGLGPEPDYSLRLWNLNDSKEIGRLEGHTKEVRFVKFSNDGHRALSAGLEALIFWDTATCQPITRTSFWGLGLATADLCPDGRHALTASGDGTLRLWDLTTSTVVWKCAGPPRITHLKISPDGQQALIACADGSVRLFGPPESPSAAGQQP